MADGACRAVLALALAATLLLSGCSAPFSAGSEAATPTDRAPQTVEPTPDDGVRTPATPTPRVVSVETEVVFDRTRRLLGTDRRITPTVEVHEQKPNATLDPDDFEQAIGFREFNINNRMVAGASRSNEISVSSAYRSRPAALERTLAHEYLHLVQFDRGLQNDIYDRLYPNESDPTVDTDLAGSAVLEGHGQYAEDAYWQRYQAEGPRPSERLRARYEYQTGMFRRVAARYLYGARYLKTRGGVGNFSALYDDPPRTYEQVLHPGTDEPPVALNATGVASDDWLKSAESNYQRTGELYVRLALRSELSRERSVAAAAGWGNDRVLEFVRLSGDRRGYAWVIRFDDAANATEFAEAADDYARKREARSDETTVRLERVDPRTVVLLYGPATFVDETGVRTEGGNVTAVAPGSGT